MKIKDQKQREADVEILKAVAQAWHGHSSSSKTTRTTLESDARRQYFKGQPSRFKIEAISVAVKTDRCNASWDFGQSLWDSYEIVTVSRRLEMGLLVSDDSFVSTRSKDRSVKRHKESRNSLRNLFYRMSSKKSKDDALVSRN
ncbi:hypothetical protein F511_18927 [Dorcoceras hygrometricum]|uniref:Uncharacterized protein n=1 Tax=Dorcoceras hygrometricum TaxID=472368 RepID=A0A2Z7AVY7_9LAMI|nr:hypothetical protein F511_18927 [Dorcoceras hygrometricum]